MSQARLIDPITDPDWLTFVDGSPTAGIFHHPRWLELLHAQYGYELRACCVGNGAEIEAGIPIARIESRLTGKRLVSLPFSDVCSPAFAAGAGPTAWDSLGPALVEEAERAGLDLTVHAAVPNLPGAHIRGAYVRHLLPLAQDPAQVERRYSKSQIRRGIKKARREGLRSEHRTDRDALDAFYSLHLKTRRKLGVPIQPKRFIRRFEELFDEGLGFVSLIFDGQRPIAAGVFLTYKGTMTYKYGASDPASLGKRPNNLLFSDAIRWACEAGFRTLDFGRTDVDNKGLRSFKGAWGANELDLSYTYLSDSTPPHTATLRDRVMGGVIRRSPAVVSRLVGEALYRHAG